MFFNTTIKGGLPVVAYAERDSSGWYVTDIYWRARKGPINSKPVPARLFNAVVADPAEMERLSREAAEEYSYAAE